MNIKVSSEFHQICPQFLGGAIMADVTNSTTTQELWNEIERISKSLQENYTTDTIKRQSGISATREAYRRAGKDPSRYRPACESVSNSRFKQSAPLEVTLFNKLEFVNQSPTVSKLLFQAVYKA